MTDIRWPGTSQFGEQRYFVIPRGGFAGVIPNVTDGAITALVFIDYIPGAGDPGEVFRLLKEEWVGRQYQEWLNKV